MYGTNFSTVQNLTLSIAFYIYILFSTVRTQADPEQPEPHFSDCDIVPLEPEENDDKIEKVCLNFIIFKNNITLWYDLFKIGSSRKL